MYYRYVKANPRSYPVKSARIVFSSLSLFIGGICIVIVAWPIVSFKLTYGRVSSTIISPIPSSIVKNVQFVQNNNRLLGVNTIDYTNAQNWFPQVAQKKTSSPVDSYTLSIPKLGIKDALAIIGSDDLSKSLIHYGGTGLPGQYGNAVTFGHSVLPIFYNPKNYTAIFSTLPTLKEGDEIVVKYDGVVYTYRVIHMAVVDPDDVSGLEQRYDDSYLTLVTCVPPGTYNQRLWVTARLVHDTN